MGVSERIPSARSFFCVALVAVFLTAEQSHASLVTITGVTDTVRIVDSGLGASSFDKSDSGTNTAGQFLSVLEGTGEHATGGYQTQQFSTYTTTSVFSNAAIDIPSPGSIGPDAFGIATSTVTFTATDDSMYTANGDNEFGATFEADSLFKFKLRNLTTNTDLFDGQDGWLEGTDISFLTGSLTGNIVNGNTYEWTTEYTLSKNADFSTMSWRGTSVGGVNFTTNAVPEPSAALLFGMGLGLTHLRRRRRKKVA